MPMNCEHCGAANERDASFCEACGKPLRSTDTVGGLQTEPYLDAGANTVRSGGQGAVHLEPGDVFADRYTIVDTIGQGGMGVVYRATEELAGKVREIALKLIRADRLADERAVDKLISEGALTQDIRHPNVVAVYNVGKAGEQPFVAMEFVDGLPLREWHRRKINAREEIGVPVVGAIMNALLDGLEAAHAKGVIHRDLKPENIVLTGDPTDELATLQILDFGIARAPGTIESATGTGLGTPRYMAPEQITHPNSAGPAADLYSLSVIFYELLMDVLPHGHWQPPSGGRTDVPTAFDDLIEQGLSNRPASRPQTTQEYRERLAKALAEIEPESGTEDDKGRTPIVPPPPPPPAPNNNLRNILIGGAVGLAALAGIGALIDDDEEPEIIADPATVEIDGLTYFYDVNGDLVSLETGEIYEPDPDGGTDSDTEIDPPPPPPPPPPEEPLVTFADMAGRWNFDVGGYMNVTTDASGNFSGRGQDAFGNPQTIRGNLQTLTYLYNEGIQGAFEWDGQCHLYYPDAAGIRRGIHIDHAPGAACPTRFSQ